MIVPLSPGFEILLHSALVEFTSLILQTKIECYIVSSVYTVFCINLAGNNAFRIGRKSETEF